MSSESIADSLNAVSKTLESMVMTLTQFNERLSKIEDSLTRTNNAVQESSIVILDNPTKDQLLALLKPYIMVKTEGRDVSIWYSWGNYMQCFIRVYNNTNIETIIKNNPRYDKIDSFYLNAVIPIRINGTYSLRKKEEFASMNLF